MVMFVIYNLWVSIHSSSLKDSQAAAVGKAMAASQSKNLYPQLVQPQLVQFIISP